MIQEYLQWNNRIYRLLKRLQFNFHRTLLINIRRQLILVVLIIPSLCYSQTKEAFLGDLNLRFVPKLAVQQTYDDNILSTQSNETASWVTTISPFLMIEAKDNAQRASLAYNPILGEYINSHDDDFLDHMVEGKLDLRFSHKAAVNFFAQYQEAHEDRGTGMSLGIAEQLTKPDTYRKYHAGTQFIYGSDHSMGKIELELDAYAQRLDNRPQAASIANQDRYELSVIFFLQLRQNTSFFYEQIKSLNDYRSLPSSDTLDNDENQYFLGTKWKFTQLTSGSLKLGFMEKNFDEKSRDSTSGFAWNVNIQWNPLVHTWINLDASTRNEETSGVGDYVETTSAAFNISNQRSSAFIVSLSMAATKFSYHPTSQEEGIWTAGIDASYKMRSWLKLSTSIKHQERLSTRASWDYTRNILSAGILIEI